MEPDRTTLVSVEELSAHLRDRNWVVFDCRHDLARPEAGEAAYRQGHIPGARFLHLDRDLSGPKTGRNGRHPLPDPQQLATRLAECGVDNDAQIIAYDDAGGMFAARLWWLARWLDHDRVAVLDGGVQAWQAAGLPLTAAPPSVEPARFAYRLRPLAVDADYVHARLGQPDMVLLDARSPDRYAGRNETIDPVAGRIPGAANRWFQENIYENGRFCPPDCLREDFEPLLAGRPASQVVHTCGSGVSACHNVLAMEIAGLRGSKLYAGSWSEWCTEPSRPVERGP